MNQVKQCIQHLEPIVQKNENNEDQCLTCMETQIFSDMISAEYIIRQYQGISGIYEQNGYDKGIVQQVLDLINQSKPVFTQVSNTRKNQIEREKYLSQQKLYRKFNYNLLKQNQTCGAFSFAFNMDCSTLFVGFKIIIKVFKFEYGDPLQLLQTLDCHTHYIDCMIFLNKSNLLVSGSWDKTIIIWNQDQNDQWQRYQTLEGHSGYLYCFDYNKNEDLLISGCRDRTIKFWKKNNLNWICQQTIYAESEVLSLSLSKSSTRLISCGSSDKILVMEGSSESQWIITQRIEVGVIGQQLCFLNDNQFVFQGLQEYLEIYSYEQRKKEFCKEKQISVQKVDSDDCYLYPCIFIEQKKMLIIRNGLHINFFTIDRNQNYVLLQSTKFPSKWDNGITDSDGFFWVSTNDVGKFQYID